MFRGGPVLSLAVIAGAALTFAGSAPASGVAFARDGQEFESLDVELLSWIPLAGFPGPPIEGADVTGYVSPSGREYVVLGFTTGTAFIEITDPYEPAIVGFIAHSLSQTSDQAVYRDHAYIVTAPSGIGVRIVDLSGIDDGVIEIVGSYTGTAENRISSARNIFVNAESGFAYIGGGDVAEGGLAMIDLADPATPDLAGTFGGRFVEDVTVVSYGPDTPYAGREIAFVAARASGFAILDVTDKSGVLPLTLNGSYTNRTWCVHCWPSADRRHLFVADERDEIEVQEIKQVTTYVLDITDLEGPVELEPIVGAVPTSDHNLFIRGRHLFQANYQGGFRVYDVSDATAPIDVGYLDTYPDGDGTGVDHGAFGIFAGLPSGVVAISDIDRGLFLVNPAASQPLVYEDVADGVLADPAEGQGAAWVDVEDDGDLDLYVTNGGTANRLFRNDGAGGFVDATAGPLGDMGDGRAGVWGDIDRDGDPDLYLVNAVGANRLIRNDGGAGFTDVTDAVTGDAGAGRGAAWADVEGDGDLDLYVASFGSANRLFLNDGVGGFEDAAGALGVDDEGRSMGVAWADYDSDGDPDLAVTNFGDASRLYRNDDAGFVEMALEPVGSTRRGTGCAWADYDGDGDLDLFVAGFEEWDALFRNDGDAGFVNVAAEAGVEGGEGASVGVSWGDCDRDGWIDLYVVDLIEGVRLYRNTRDGTFLPVGGSNFAAGGNPLSAVQSDVDGDGDLDLYVTNTSGPNHLYLNQVAPPRHWLSIRLRGVSSNPDGIGARVRIVAGDRAQIREVSAGSGYLGQEPARATFGLGTSAVVDSLRIRWPSGAVFDTTDVTGDQVIELVERDNTPVFEEPGPPVTPVSPVAFRLHVNAPNPFSPATRITYDLARAARVRLTVLDVAGRMVRSLVTAEQPAGRYRVSWDGRDDVGRESASGIYFYRLEAGAQSATRRMSLVR